MGKAAVIGSGIGGLAAAIQLAAKGYQVVVFEKNSTPGGKIAEIKHKGYRFDTGPSLLTMPELVEELFEVAGYSIDSYFSYKKLDISCKYFFENGNILKAYSDKEKFKKECWEKLGEPPQNIDKHLDKAAEIYDITSPVFIFNSLHKASNYWKPHFLKSMLKIPKLQFYKTMYQQNRKNFQSPELVQLFSRYATYNGSNPYKAPATLDVISHIENNKGVFFPEKGMYSLVDALYNLAVNGGVEFRLNTQVDKINVEGKKATGIKTGGEDLGFDLVVSGADSNYVYENMLPSIHRKTNKKEWSSSALIFYWGVKKEFPQLELHNILFSTDYKAEFEAIFSEKRLSDDLTVYLFISSKMVQGDAPSGAENWYVMVNAPANYGQDWEQITQQARKAIISKINRVLDTHIEEFIEFEKVGFPITIEQETFSKNGALYGHSSNSMFSAFLRHPNFLSKLQDLYFVGGSVHPGGGIPLCLASAKIIDKEIPKAT